MHRDPSSDKTPSSARRRLFPSFVFSLTAFLGMANADVAHADVAVGATLSNTEIRDARDAPAQILGLGEKVLVILYTDPDVADQNDLFADHVKATPLDRSIFQSLGIVNMEDAPAKPNWMIRAVVRSKVKKYNVNILTDPKRLLIKAWDLGNCNEKSVVLLIGKDRKLKYIKKGPISTVKDSTGKSEADVVLDLIKKTIEEARTPAG